MARKYKRDGSGRFAGGSGGGGGSVKSRKSSSTKRKRQMTHTQAARKAVSLHNATKQSNKNVKTAKKAADRKLKKLQSASVKAEALQNKNGGLTKGQKNSYMRTGRQAVKAQGKYAQAQSAAANLKKLSRD